MSLNLGKVRHFMQHSTHDIYFPPSLLVMVNNQTITSHDQGATPLYLLHLRPQYFILFHLLKMFGANLKFGVLGSLHPSVTPPPPPPPPPPLSNCPGPDFKALQIFRRRKEDVEAKRTPEIMTLKLRYFGVCLRMNSCCLTYLVHCSICIQSHSNKETKSCGATSC